MDAPRDAAAAAGAVAAADILEAKGLPGKVSLWGCPAEEILAGKVYMARDGAFRGNDAIIAWHPWTQNKVSRKGGSAIDSMLFEFNGKTTFDKEHLVGFSGTHHESDQPPHLVVADTNLCATTCAEEFGNPCENFCPAAVYEMVDDPKL